MNFNYPKLIKKKNRENKSIRLRVIKKKNLLHGCTRHVYISRWWPSGKNLEPRGLLPL